MIGVACCEWSIHVREADEATGEVRMVCAHCGEWWPMASYELMVETAEAEERDEEAAVGRVQDCAPWEARP